MTSPRDPVGADAGRRLWEKGAPLDADVHRFTVGDDPAWDERLVYWDCLGSAAHARTIHRAGILNDPELSELLDGLRSIADRAARGGFPIPPELEDCHTAIEAELTRRGPAGAKIHTGRSRNDQVATAMRLFMRNRALGWIDLLGAFIRATLDRLERDGDVPMPGYTHLRAAMPSSVGLWLHAWAEGAFAQILAALDLLERLDACPLGTGAGFGAPLDLDRAFAARSLGFTRPQRNPIDAQNSRGRSELCFVRVAIDVGALFEKLASDLMLFTTREFGFFSLPAELTTGSSIMPQKRNPDVLELLRAHAGRLRARGAELEAVTSKLPSSYFRDLQLTKAPAMRAADEADALLRIGARLIAGLEIHCQRLADAMTPELYATHAAIELVRQGLPFRDAYRRVAAELDLDGLAGYDLAPYRRSVGRADPAVISELKDELAAAEARAAGWRKRIEAAESAVLAAPQARRADRGKT